MCDIAPLQMRCIYDGYQNKLMSCSVNMLECSFTELIQSIPIIWNTVLDYRCKNFTLDTEYYERNKRNG